MSDIIDRIEAALEKARWRKLELRGLYLDPDDYADFARAETASYQQDTGSEALVWPCSYEHILLLSKKRIPVKESLRSAVYATSGERIPVPKGLSHRVAA